MTCLRWETAGFCELYFYSPSHSVLTNRYQLLVFTEISYAFLLILVFSGFLNSDLNLPLKPFMVFVFIVFGASILF